MKKLKKLRTLRVACLAAIFIPILKLNAASIIYQFEPVSVGPTATVQAPPIVVTFQDWGSGKVLLTITTANLGGEFLSDLYFNFDPADSVNQLRFTRLYNSAGSFFPESRVFTGDNAFQAGSYGCYDIHLAFSKPSLGKSSNGYSIAYQIGEPGLNALDFDFTSFSRNAGSYFAAARLQGSCNNPQWLSCTSARLQPVPEPASAGLLILAAGTGFICRRAIRNKPAG